MDPRSSATATAQPQRETIRESFMQDAEDYFWPIVLGMGLMLASAAFCWHWQRSYLGINRVRVQMEQDLAICATRIELARAVIRAQLAQLKNVYSDRPPELIALQSCANSTIELFRRLTTTSQLIFDIGEAQAAADAWILHDLGLAVVRQRLPTEIEVQLSPAARTMLEQERQDAFIDWQSRNSADKADPDPPRP
jgi:hypothetical protein